MKILEIIDSLAAGGGQRFVIDLCNEMVKQDHEVVLVTFRSLVKDGKFYQSEIHPNVRYIDYSGDTSLISKIKQIKFIYTIIKQEKPDVVHAHLIAFSYIIIPSIIYSKISFYYTVHNIASQDVGGGFLTEKMRKIFLKKKIKPITISKYCTKTFIDYYGFSSYATIENGCRSLSLSDKIEQVRNEINGYKKTPSTKIYINVGRVTPQKNHLLLVESFNQFVEEGNDAILLIVGKYEMESRIMCQINNINKSNRIFFIGLKQNIVDYLSLSDFFCLSSSWEGLPISLLEAGLSGCYSLCTPVGGIVDVIIDDSIGLTSLDLSVESYTNILKRSYLFSINKAKIKRYFQDCYSMSHCANRYLRLFEGKM